MNYLQQKIEESNLKKFRNAEDWFVFLYATVEYFSRNNCIDYEISQEHKDGGRINEVRLCVRCAGSTRWQTFRIDLTVVENIDARFIEIINYVINLSCDSSATKKESR
jgi:hypothetical protein